MLLNQKWMNNSQIIKKMVREKNMKNKHFYVIDFLSYFRWICLVFVICYVVNIVVEVLLCNFDINYDVHCMKGNNGISLILDTSQLFIQILCCVNCSPLPNVAHVFSCLSANQHVPSEFFRFSFIVGNW